MTVGQALATVALWDSRRFATADIAQLLHVREADVEQVIHLTREERRRRG